MLNNLKDKLNQPLSLRWKWGIILLIVFAPLTFFGLFYFYIQSSEITNDIIHSEYQKKYEDIDEYLESFNFPFLRYASDNESLNITNAEEYLNQQRALDFLKFFEDENTVIRIFNASNQMIYESESVSLPSVSHSESLQRINHNGRELLVGLNSLNAASTGQKIGSFQLIIYPEKAISLNNELRNHYVRILSLSTILVALIAFLLSHRFLKPLTYLNDSLDLVEEENLSDIRVKRARTNDEWSDLNIHINKLLDKIDNYVTSQKQFVEDVSHELRTPVAIVEGHLKLLNRWGKDDPEILDESISASLQEMTRMKGLVQEMLDLSRADNVEVDYQDAITEIYSTTKQVFNNFVLIHEDFEFYLDSDDEGEELYIKAFRNHFEQILIILLDNAVKYSRDRKEIHISVSTNLSNVEIAVQDFGEGMTDEDREKVFGRFYRIDKARTRDRGGNGLGLSIAKQLVQGYKGKIRVDSVLNHGSIFYVEFPILSDVRQIYKSKQIEQKKNL